MQNQPQNINIAFAGYKEKIEKLSSRVVKRNSDLLASRLALCQAVKELYDRLTENGFHFNTWVKVHKPISAWTGKPYAYSTLRAMVGEAANPNRSKRRIKYNESYKKQRNYVVITSTMSTEAQLRAMLRVWDFTSTEARKEFLKYINATITVYKPRKAFTAVPYKTRKAA